MNDDKYAAIQDLLRLAVHTTIVHHIPGRIRLRVLPSGAWIARGIDLDELKRHVPGIMGVRVNILVGSVVVEYDRNELAPGLWEEFSKLRNDPGLASEMETRLVSLWK
ncbi:MAG: hypothetical protein ABFD97_24105 [Syntrophobacter sp.]